MKKAGWIDVGSMILSVLLAVLAAPRCGAQAWHWPTNWTAYGPVALPLAAGGHPGRAMLAPGALFESMPESLMIGGENYRGRPVTLGAGRPEDLRQYFGAVPRGTAIYLAARVQMPAETRTAIGAGADWWMQWWLNGQPVYDTLSAGNQAACISVTNHVFNITFPAGESVLALCVIAGSAGCALAAGGPAEIAAAANPGDYAAAYAAARRMLFPKTSSGHQRPRLDFAAAQAGFQRAVELARTDRDLAQALLAVVETRLYDPADGDDAALRVLADRIMALPDAAGAQRAQAQIFKGETFLRAREYAPARREFAAAAAEAGGPLMRQKAQLALAWSYIQERNHPAARWELQRLLALPDLDVALRWQAQAANAAMDVASGLQGGHPRLFFNAAAWPAVKARALGAERGYYDKISAQVAKMPAGAIPADDYGSRLMRAAFVYRVEPAPALLEKIKHMLRGTAAFYLRREYNDRLHVYSQVGALAALDWIWDDLTPAEQRALAEQFLRHAHTLYAEDRFQNRLHNHFTWYYQQNMFWYAGLALLDDALEDLARRRALEILGQGYCDNLRTIDLAFARMGDDGVWHLNLEYTFGEIPTILWAFMHTWQSALNAKIPDAWHNLGLNPDYVLRNVLGFTGGSIRHFGYSRSHGLGEMRGDLLYDHLGNFIHFFGRAHPEAAAIAGYLRRQMLQESDALAGGSYPVIPFLLTGLERAPAPEIPPGLPLARHFENVGLVLMGSGFNPGDTRALFAAGGGVLASEHFDTAHFAIYRNGHLALDSGARGAGSHSVNYWEQTVAHNCILVRVPDETLKSIHGGGERDPGLAPAANTGGQNVPGTAARVLGFASRPAYAYVATDAAAVYHPEKCSQMTRQFVFLAPNKFVVFDRVTAVDAGYPKTWLLHTANEPAVTGREFYAAQDQGELFCRTLLPADAGLVTIGGPGREFWADGRNWPVPQENWSRRRKPAGGIPEAMGRWRVEVQPGAARGTDYFLHYLETRAPGAHAPAATELRETESRVELAIQAGDWQATVGFKKTGPAGGHLRITAGKTVLADELLRPTVMPQTGLARAE